jgi:choline-sulfatase
MNKKPHNILILCSDEHAPQVMGCMGDPLVRTPNMDRLAARGVIFDNAYCNNPICVPGRYSTLTGKYVRDIGSLHYGDGLDPKTWTYPKHFAAAGWQTTCVGKQHFMGLEQMHGWMFRPFGDMEVVGYGKTPGYKAANDTFPPRAKIPGYGSLKYWVQNARPGNDGFIIFDESVTRETQIALDDYYNHSILPLYNPNRPLLLQVGWKTPHWPLYAPDELYEYYRERVTMPEAPEDDRAMYLPGRDVSEENILNARAAYWGLVEYTDRQIGKVLDTLEHLGVLDDFIIIYTSDHGEFAGELGCWGKGRPEEWSSRVPFIISGPGIQQGKRIEENVSLVDLYPTICDYAGLPEPPGLRGDSLKPLIEAEALPGIFRERIVVSEFFANGDRDYKDWVMTRKGNTKFVTFSDGTEYLFDVANDPLEQHDLSEEPAYQKIKIELKQAVNGLPEPYKWNENYDYITPDFII